MAGYETGSMENDPSASVCEHGQLKRKCEICSEWKPRALEAEARVEELQSQRDQTLSMLGAIISSVGGIYHIPDHMLQVGYEFKSERGNNETIVCARKV